MIKENRLILSIGDIARILGVTTTTVRNWEKYGLITPKRKENGYRYFYAEEVEHLRLIKRCMVDAHMNIKTAKAMSSQGQITDLETYYQENMDDMRNSTMATDFCNEKWKAIRKKKALTLDEVGRATGLSASYLSKIENNNVPLSYNIACRLANYYGESLFFFTNSYSNIPSVIHNGEGQVITSGFLGTQSKMLSTLHNKTIHPVLFNIQPYGGTLKSHSHDGEEFVYCLSGKIDITLNDSKTFVLKIGDSLHFSAKDKHFCRNSSNKQCTLLWIYCSSLKT